MRLTARFWLRYFFTLPFFREMLTSTPYGTPVHVRKLKKTMITVMKSTAARPAYIAPTAAKQGGAYNITKDFPKKPASEASVQGGFRSRQEAIRPLLLRFGFEIDDQRENDCDRKRKEHAEHKRSDDTANEANDCERLLTLLHTEEQRDQADQRTADQRTDNSANRKST
jgi:hypothetical protein